MLVELYRDQDDQKAIDTLLYRHEMLICKYGLSFNIPTVEKEDIMQVGRISIIKAAKAFQTYGKVKFDTLATTIIQNDMIKLRNFETKGSRVPRNSMRSIYQRISNDENGSTYEELIAACDDTESEAFCMAFESKIMEEWNDQYPKGSKLNGAIRDIIDGENMSDVANARGIKSTTVRNAVAKFRLKVGELIEGSPV